MMDRQIGVVVAALGILVILGAVFSGHLLVPDEGPSGDAAVPAPVEAADDDTGSKGLFYRVNGSANDAYLFGSIHFGHQEMYPLHETVEQTFREADILVMEIDMVGQSQAAIDRKMRERGTYDDRRMSDVVDNDMFAAAYDILGSYGYDRGTVDRMKPWYAANQISEATMSEAGYDPEQGSEQYFADLADEQNMSVIGLETVADQAAAFETMSDAAQERYVQGTIAQHTAGADMDVMARHWMNGEETVFAQQRRIMRSTAQTPSMAAFNRALLDDREERMTTTIMDLLEDGPDTTYFIVVGSLHLVGENSITDNMEAHGYNVTSMYG